ncbi:hypothetical protein SUGI_0113770 [Cryptomeria japonica]|uniref:two-component response regulator ARR2 n=1 Tax=Cryptomeria japonica TaxID=3369 RepID=UPI0024089D55|nr:two-component response regulator ARR2 [Cryptomeria japonica]GLJ09668.1 hypothetical protein SUGI_0113770 [Cryptomeria japonica]
MGGGSAYECLQGLAVPKQETKNSLVNYPNANEVNGFTRCNSNNINGNNNDVVTSGSEMMERVPDQFPAGLRVLVVDDDPTCLKILHRMLQTCQYEVTTCTRATVALSLLREKKGGFDLVISDVYMPDMDGFKLLEQVGLEMDLPVIMMSADGETSVVMKGIKHGACDYLLKPVRIEALKNIWQHVIRKKRNDSKDLEQSGSVEDGDRHRKGSDDVEYASSANEGINSAWKHSKKRKEVKEEEDDGEQDNDDSSTLKKPRVVWSVELHQQFVCAVNQLGIDKAVPKRILELMNVQGLTRENVASHLQKYRLYLRRLSGVGQQPNGLNASFGGTMEANFGSVPSLERSDLQALAATGQISRQTLAAIQGGLFSRVNAGNTGMPSVVPGFLLQPELQGPNCNQTERGRFVQPFISSQRNLLQGMPASLDIKQLAQSNPHIPSFGNVGLSMDDSSSGIPIRQGQVPASSVGLGGVGQMSGISNSVALNTDNNALMVQMMQQQQKQHSIQHHQQQMPTSTGQQQQHSSHYHQQQMTTSAGQQQQRSLHNHQQQMTTSAGLLQQRTNTQFQNEQLEGGQVQNMPSPNLLRHQILLNDIGGISNQLSTATNNSTVLGNQPVGVPSSAQVNQIPTSMHGLAQATSNSSGRIGHSTSVDYQNRYLPVNAGNSYSLASTVGLSPQLSSMGSCDESNSPEVRLNDIVNSQTLRSPNPSYGTLNSMGQSLSESTKQGWHAQNLSRNLGLSQTGNSVQNFGYSQPFPASQAMNISSIQDKAQNSFVSGEKIMGLPNRLPSDARSAGTLSRFHSEQLIDNELRLEEDGASDLMANAKFEGGGLAEQFMQDDLMGLFFKQQHEGLGSADSEFGTDGYQLDNIHVT